MEQEGSATLKAKPRWAAASERGSERVSNSCPKNDLTVSRFLSMRAVASWISLLLFELVFRHSMRVHDLPLAGGVELQREKETGFQLVGRAPITRRVQDYGVGVGPLAHLQNVTVRRATAGVKVFWQMPLAKLCQLYAL